MSRDMIELLNKQDMPNIFNIASQLLIVGTDNPEGAMTLDSRQRRRTFSKSEISHWRAQRTSEPLCRINFDNLPDSFASLGKNQCVRR